MQKGSHIMLGGIVFQLGMPSFYKISLVFMSLSTVVIICYIVLGSEFFWRFSRSRPVHSGGEENSKVVLSGRLQLLISALVFNTGCLFIR